MSKKVHIILFGSLLNVMFGCTSKFDYSPFDANVNLSELNTNIQKSIIAMDSINSDTVKFAVISDTHLEYDALRDAIATINKQVGLSFVLCCGDITYRGTANEFEWYWDKAKNSKYPIMTVIGNHDCLANGKAIYNRMFGPSNSSFQTGKYNFIMFDDVVWENDNKSPDFKWLNQALSEKNNNILFTHIPVWCPEVSKYKQQYDSVLNNNKLLMVISGHTHHNEDSVINEVPHYVIADISKRQFALVSLANSSVTLKRVSY